MINNQSVTLSFLNRNSHLLTPRFIWMDNSYKNNKLCNRFNDFLLFN